jgi:putative tryptophan/tyrosine transport system substrate-binding protein
MKRRGFVLALAATAMCPRSARAQHSQRVRRIGILLFSDEERAVIRPFLQELQALGYVDGKTVVIDYRDAEARYERLSELAGELVRLNPDVI